ncbi:MAG: hypothetical protein C4545_08945 [Anaerolineaceae bacterium]|jgi:hypothetical protein|nr:MAG: hypothetical protein C4545_08945 [Anaerolineaceae bacterium]
MKRKYSISIAVALTAILVVVSTAVWAGPNRQGTVPVPPDEVELIANTTVSLGTVEITSSVAGKAIRVKDPEKDFGPAPEGLNFLTDAVTVVLSKEGEVKVCYPYPQDTEEKDGNIYKWDKDAEEWTLLKSTISGDPKQICIVDKGITDGTYSLIGK